MSATHSSNAYNETAKEEHDGILYTKKTSLISSATIYAVVNTSAPCVGNSIVTVANTPLSTTFSGNVTLDDGSLTGIIGNITISDSKGFVGLVSVSGFVNPLPITFSGNVTLDVGSLAGIRGNLTLSDSKGYIGLVSVAQPISTTLDGNVTISDSKGFIGLVSVSGFTNPLPVTSSGNVTLDDGSLTGLVGNVTISDSKQFIGLVSVSGFANPLPVTSSGNVTLDDGSLTGIVGNVTVEQGDDPWNVAVKGNVTLSDSKGFIGLVSIAQPLTTTSQGNITLDDGSLTGIIGNVTLSDSRGFIGLTTIVPTYLSSYTSFATVISSLATIIIPPSNQRIVVKDVFVSSLGLSEMSIWSARSTTTINIIPPTSLATTAGYVMNMGDSGMRLSALDDALTIRSSSTIGVMVNVRFDNV